MAGAKEHLRHSKRGDPVWELAEAEFPRQGDWTEEEFLGREFEMGVEYVEGVLEFLPMPTVRHQKILRAFFLLLNKFVSDRKLGEVLFAGLHMRTVPRKLRLPDVVFMRAESAAKQPDDAWQGGDLVFECVSGGKKDRERDLVIKPAEYAKAGISEYWIADYEKGTVSVLRLSGEKYVEHGVCKRGEVAKSNLLKGFEVDVKTLLDAE